MDKLTQYRDYVTQLIPKYAGYLTGQPGEIEAEIGSDAKWVIRSFGRTSHSARPPRSLRPRRSRVITHIASRPLLGVMVGFTFFIVLWGLSKRPWFRNWLTWLKPTRKATPPLGRKKNTLHQ